MMIYLKNFAKIYKIEILVFLAAFIFRIAFLVILVLKNGDNLMKLALAGDSYSYYNLAFNLKYFFSFHVLPMTDFSDTFLRTPGYPLFSALIFVIFNKSIIALFAAQAIISGFSAVLIYKIVSIFNWRRVIAVGAALLFAFEPMTALFSNSILTETLFLFLFLAFIYILARGIIKNDFRWERMMLAGFLFGAGTLVRPVLYPFLIVTAVFIFLGFYNKKGLYNTLKITACFIIGAYVLIFPWILRNKMTYGSWSFSSIGSYHFYSSFAVPFYAYEMKTPDKDIAQKKLDSEIKPYLVGDKYDIRNDEIYKKFGMQILSKNILGYAFFHLSNMPSFFLSNGYRNLGREMGFEVAKPKLNYSFMRLLIDGKIKTLISFFRDNILYFVIFVLGAAFWVLINLFMLIGVFRGLKRRNDFNIRLMISFMFLIIVYFAVVSGPEAYYKMRFPANPFMFILAFYGLNEIINF